MMVGRQNLSQNGWIWITFKPKLHPITDDTIKPRLHVHRHVIAFSRARSSEAPNDGSYGPMNLAYKNIYFYFLGIDSYVRFFSRFCNILGDPRGGSRLAVPLSQLIHSENNALPLTIKATPPIPKQRKEKGKNKDYPKI